MHPTAWICAHLFFLMLHNWLPNTDKIIRILDIGSADINGNMKDAIKTSAFNERKYSYIGLDMDDKHNVDIVVTPGEPADQWPLNDNSFDIIISCSCFEHDDSFWETFSRMNELLTPGGFMFISVPSKVAVHRYPVDNWRFYPDSANALAKWANKQQQDKTDANEGILPTGSLHVLYSEFIPGDEDVNMIFWKSTYPETTMTTTTADHTLLVNTDNNDDISGSSRSSSNGNGIVNGEEYLNSVENEIIKLKKYFSQHLQLSIEDIYRFYTLNSDHLDMPESVEMKFNESQVVIIIPTHDDQMDEYSLFHLSDDLLLEILYKYAAFSIFCRVPYVSMQPQSNLFERHVILSDIFISDHRYCSFVIKIVVREIDLISDNTHNLNETIDYVVDAFYLPDIY